MELPEIVPDPDLTRICEAVGRGHLRVADGLHLIQDKMRLLLNGCSDINKMSVLAVRLVEGLHPESVGLLLDHETMRQMWALPQQTTETHPELHMSFLVLSCLQLTCMGERHEGAKALTRAIDQLLPERPTIGH
jgi:hypothetical protein